MLKLYLSPKLRHAVETRHGICRFLGLDKFFAPILVLSMPILNGETTLKMPISSPSINKQTGFSLLELLVVVALMGIIAIGSMSLLIDDGDWKRQDETEARWDAIRKAIIGEPNLSLNASPYVAGYVADMGRLPQNIGELFIQGTQPDWAPAIAITDFNNDPTNLITVSGGWRGPYLYTAGSAQYRDGWNNQDTNNVANDNVNFGWVFNMLIGVFPDHSALQVQSLGNGNQPGGNDFAQDFPDAGQRIIDVNQWQVNSMIVFNLTFNKPPLCAPAPCTPPTVTNLDLRVFNFEDDGIQDSPPLPPPPVNEPEDSVITRSSNPQVIDNTVASQSFSINSADPIQVSISDPLGFRIGNYTAVIMCNLGTLNLADDIIYDGDCNLPVNKNPRTYFFSILPSTRQVTITWNLP